MFLCEFYANGLVFILLTDIKMNSDWFVEVCTSGKTYGRNTNSYGNKLA
jgi:hypothetical protein